VAKPEVRNGYIRIANELLEALSACRDLSGRELRLFLYIIRMTYGYNKKSADLQLSWISRATGLSQAHACHARAALVKRRMISYARTGKGSGLYAIQKDWELWDAGIDRQAMRAFDFAVEGKIGDGDFAVEGKTENDFASDGNNIAVEGKVFCRRRQNVLPNSAKLGSHHSSSNREFSRAKDNNKDNNKDKLKDKLSSRSTRTKSKPVKEENQPVSSAQSDSYISTVDVMREFLAKKKAEEEGHIVEN